MRPRALVLAVTTMWVGVLLSTTAAAMGVPDVDVAAGHPGSVSGASANLLTLERRVLDAPENLQAAAQYRQEVIADSAYDRAIAVFERLSKRPGAGGNAFINLALAYVDKIPTSGSIRQALLGRDAIHALTRAIELVPSELPYFVRGLVNLYYDKAMFHRTDKGVADLEEARRLATLRNEVAYLPRILLTLGDGYFRLDNSDKAHQMWRDGLALAPENEPLRHRIVASYEQLRGIIAQAFDANVRVDTSLRELDLATLAAMGGTNR